MDDASSGHSRFVAIGIATSSKETQMDKKLALTGALSLAALVAVANLAHARTQTWTGFAPESASQNTCFASDGAGGGIFISGAAGCTSGWIDSTLVWDTAGNKTVTITGKSTAAGQITGCAVRTMDANGVLFQYAPFPAFTVFNVYQAVSVAVSVPVGGTSQLECNLSNPAARILKADYLNP
jgi:hypothetical protein